VLYGRNTASYKFALASALLDLKPGSGELVKLDELAPVYAQQVAKHLRIAPKQITTSNGKFIQSCLAFNEDNDLSKLVDMTMAHGFANVIDAFHIVGSTPVHHPFFFDDRKANRGIRITEEFSQMMAGLQASNLDAEVTSRWNLVETAWNLGVSANLLAINHDDELGELFAIDASQRRRRVTSSRNALNGYQKGCCFYCFTDLLLDGQRRNADVDHFFPHRLKQADLGVNLDGVWNLVLACPTCNRGAKGKFDRIPSLRLLERLHQRNEYLIGSHHPLRETLIQQTGMLPSQRAGFLNRLYQTVQLSPSLAWEPPSV
jgi:5-methylcytosine-specific restriction endonuclease McrA